MNFLKLRSIAPLRQHSRTVGVRCYRPFSSKLSGPLPTSHRAPLSIPRGRKQLYPTIATRQYGLEYEVIKPVENIQDVEAVDTELQTLFTSGTKLNDSITATGNNLKISSELTIQIAYTTLVDLTIQLAANAHPGGLPSVIRSLDEVSDGLHEPTKGVMKEVSDALQQRAPNELHSTFLRDAVGTVREMFDKLEQVHVSFGAQFADFHEKIDHQVQTMKSLLKRVELSNKYMNDESEAAKIELDQFEPGMKSALSELDTISQRMEDLYSDIDGFVKKHEDAEQPQNFGDGFLRGFFGIGYLVSGIKMDAMEKSIESAKAELLAQHNLQETQQAAFDRASPHVTHAKITMETMNRHLASTREHTNSLHDVIDSCNDAMKFIVGRKNAISEIRNDLNEMQGFADSYESFRIPLRQAMSLAKDIVRIADATPHWPGATVPLVIVVALLRGSAKYLFPTHHARGNDETRDKLHDVTEKVVSAYSEYLSSSHQPVDVRGYLGDLEVNWEEHYEEWHRLAQT